MLMGHVYRSILPAVHEQLTYWKKRAMEIPNDELRTQALASIEDKTFHCEGGSILALAAKTKKIEAIQFIVAYQTISDYLDNLCDRSTSLDPLDFEALHWSMEDALTVDAKPRDYYQFRMEKEDGGYLVELLQTCQDALKQMDHYLHINQQLLQLCSYYCDLQIHKHVRHEEREGRLQAWFEEHEAMLPQMTWYEFSACAGSTLGIFCLVSYAMREDFQPEVAEQIFKGYFPYIQGLHILLDYFIDQEEDLREGDLNFCFYYENKDELANRLIYFIQQADKYTKMLPDPAFHKCIHRGLLGIYLSDAKATDQKQVQQLARVVLRESGRTSRFFYWNGRLYRWFQRRKA